MKYANLFCGGIKDKPQGEKFVWYSDVLKEMEYLIRWWASYLLEMSKLMLNDPLVHNLCE